MQAKLLVLIILVTGTISQSLLAEEYDCWINTHTNNTNFIVFKDDSTCVDYVCDMKIKSEDPSLRISGSGYLNDDTIRFTATENSSSLVWSYDLNQGYIEINEQRYPILCRYDYHQ